MTEDGGQTTTTPEECLGIVGTYKPVLDETPEQTLNRLRDGTPAMSSDDTVTVEVPTDGYVTDAPAIEDVPADLAKEVPDEEWAKLAVDARTTHRAAMANEIADFVKAKGHGRLDSLADIIRRRWGRVECHPAEGGG